VTSENGASVAVIDAKRHRLLTTIKLEGELTRPMGTVASPDGKRMFISTGRGKSVIEIDTTTNKPLRRIEVGDRPWGLAITQDGKTLFSANGPSNDISIVDVESWQVRAKVPVGMRPWGMVFVP
jgi:YVTN family beta-propeller protein